MDNLTTNDAPRAPRRKEIKAQRQTQAGGKPAPSGVNYARAQRKGKERAQGRAWWSAPVICIAVCALAAVLVFSGGALARWRQFQVARAQVLSDTFYPGIQVDGQDLSGMTLSDALAAWGDRDLTAYGSCQVRIRIDGTEFTLTPEDMGFHTDSAQVLTSAYSLGRYGTFSQRLGQVNKLAGAWGRKFATSNGFDEELLMKKLSAIATQVSKPAVEATIQGFSEEGGFTFAPGTDGLVVDVHELYDAVTEAIAQGGGRVEVSRKVVSAGRTTQDLQKLYGQISTCKTSARSSSKNRLINLKLACEAINGLRIEPGQLFSYNDTLGKRTTDKGYKNAPALSSGSHTMQVGGGICQVSTTLFNAVAKADMEIVKRFPHSIPSSYVARGLDATVNWPNQDFQFKNNSQYPIYLSAHLNASKQVVVSVYGRLNEDGVVIKLKGVTNESYAPGEPEVVFTPNLAPGQQKWVEDRRSGYKVTTYRVYYDKKGKELDRELLFKSTYAASRGKVQVGR